jgi:hypothetical protein
VSMTIPSPILVGVDPNYSCMFPHSGGDVSEFSPSPHTGGGASKLWFSTTLVGVFLLTPNYKLAVLCWPP